MLLPQTMFEILSAGGNLVIDLNKQFMMPQTLVDLAATAASNNVTLTIRNFDGKLLPQNIIAIALAGGGKVVFEQ